MKWFKKMFYIKVSQSNIAPPVTKSNTWPDADKVTVKVLAPIILMDARDESFIPVEAGTVLELTRTRNPYPLTDPWLVLRTEGMRVGGAEKCFREWVEKGKMEVISFILNNQEDLKEFK